jgi:isopentenyl phosphate kinase
VIFLKLGGSAITDKTREATARVEVIQRLAREVARARAQRPALQLLIGHGSGSFGHFTARQSGFGARGNWRAYAETGAAAARLARLVSDTFLAHGVPIVTLPPSASARCREGKLIALALAPIHTALAHGLVPLVHGDVAFDETREMTIVSTEMVFAYLARHLQPTRIILAGIVDGVFTADPLTDASARLIHEITSHTFPHIAAQLRGAYGVDVTGGMLAKVQIMLQVIERLPHLRVHIISAMHAGIIERALLNDDFAEGTVIHSGAELNPVPR